MTDVQSSERHEGKHNGGFSNGNDDNEKMNHHVQDRPPRGSYRGRRGNNYHADNIRYNSRQFLRGRGGDQNRAPLENQRPHRRRSFSDGYSYEATADESAGGDRRGVDYQRRRPRAFATQDSYNIGQYGYAGARRRFRDDDESSYQNGAPFRRNRRHESNDERDSEKTGVTRSNKNGGSVKEKENYTMLPPEEFKKYFYTVKVNNLPKNKSIKGIFHHFSCCGNVLNIYVLSDEAETAEQKDGLSKVENTVAESKDQDKNAQGEAIYAETLPNLAETEPKQAEKESQLTENEEKSAPIGAELVENDTKNEADQKDGAKNEENDPDTHSMLISFDSMQAVRDAYDRFHGRIAFEHKLSVVKFIPVHMQRKFLKIQHRNKRLPANKNLRRSSNEKQSSIGHFDEKVLVQIFGLMDLKTRCRLETVCRQWQRAMRNVTTPSPDAPALMSLVIQNTKDATQKETLYIAYDKESKTMELNCRVRYSDNSLIRRIEKVVHQISPNVEKVEVKSFGIGGTFLPILKAFSGAKSIQFENCYMFGRIDMAVWGSFNAFFNGRVTFLPVVDFSVLPVHSRHMNYKSHRRPTTNRNDKLEKRDVTGNTSAEPAKP